MADFFVCLGSILASEVFRGIMLTTGVAVAIVSVWTARILARKKQTADMMFGRRNDVEFDNGLACISKYHDAADSNIRSLANADGKNSPEAKSIRYVLNHFETLAVGVQAGIYDEEMLRNAIYGTVIHFHKCASPFIDRAREVTGRNTLYQEFRWLAQRWEKKPLKQK